MRLLPAIVLIVLLGACSWINPKDEEAEPAELVEFRSTLEVAELWSTGAGDGTNRSAPRLAPVRAGGEIWVADHEGRITAVEMDSGRELRSFETELPVSAGPAVTGDAVYLGTFEGQLVKLDRDSGDIEWRAQLSSEILGLPIQHDGIVITRAIDGRVFGIRAEDGRREWVHDRSVPLLTQRGTSDPLVRAGQAYIGFDDGAVVAIRVADGSVLWEQQVSEPEGRTELDRLADIDGPMVIVGRDLYVVTRHGRMASLALDSGRVQWVRDVASPSGLSLSRTRLAATDTQDAIWLVDRQSGNTVWREERLARRGVTRPVFSGGYLVVADKEGYLHWLNADSGEFVARARASGDRPAAAPLAVGDTLYLLDSDGELSAWRTGPGS